MNFIETIIEPEKLFLNWQGQGKDTTWFAIGEIVKNDTVIVFRYLNGTSDFETAKKNGFNGYPAFDINQQQHSNALDVFMKRLPPRNREDFVRYLESFRIPSEKRDGVDRISDFALLGYSGAKLPDDPFLISHPFDENGEKRFELLTAIAGFRHHSGMKMEINEGMDVTFKNDPENPYDPRAIKILLGNDCIGYIQRSLLNSFHKWLNENRIEAAFIERVNGTKEKPTVFLFLKIAKSN